MRGGTTFDAMVIGGGPAGSACARALVRGGLDVLVLDRAQFPRVKLCAGWLSPPVWDVLEVSPREYPAGIWEWRRCHVEHRGERHTVPGRGHFIRRVEFDRWLLERTGAARVLGHGVKEIVREGGDWVVDRTWRARLLVGAGGTHCPVARLHPRKADRPVGCQEIEFPAGAPAVAATRIGEDGEPELLLHDDLAGYSWNVPKGEWLNVGSGTAAAKQVRAAWTAARGFFLDAGHLPAAAAGSLDEAEGHSYHLFHAAHLDACHRDGAFLVGDALGLAHPLTAEGILPAVLSGRLCAEAILAGAPESYRARLEGHPVMRDYALARGLLDTALVVRDRLRRRNRGGAGARAARVVVGSNGTSRLGRRAGAAAARGFAWMFSGRPIPYGGVLRTVLRGVDSVLRLGRSGGETPSEMKEA